MGKRKLAVTTQEYYALVFIETLSADARHLVMTAQKNQHGDGFVLEGSSREFHALGSDLSDEAQCRFAPPPPSAYMAQLTRIYRLLAPDAQL